VQLSQFFAGCSFIQFIHFAGESAIHVKRASLDKMSARSLGATIARLFAHARLNLNGV
jgi:hypothetical protein